MEAAVSAFFNNEIFFGGFQFWDYFCSFCAFYGVSPPFMDNFEVMWIMGVIAVYDWDAIFAGGFYKLLKVWDYVFGSFTFQISSNEIVKHVNNYDSRVLQNSIPQGLFMLQSLFKLVYG